MNDDNLESLLRSGSHSEPLPPKPAPDLSERVLRSAAQRQTQRRRRIVAAGFVGCYFGGLLTMWLCLPADSTRTITATQVVEGQRESSPRTEPDQAIDHSAQLEMESPVETAVADSSHQASPNSRKTLYERFRDLGDASHARYDFASAARYYQMALDSATEADLHASAGHDNLLLLSLRQEYIESTHSKSRGESS